MNHLFFLLTLVAYVGSFVAYIGYLVAGRDWSARIGSILLAGGLVAHYFALLERARGDREVLHRPWQVAEPHVDELHVGVGYEPQNLFTACEHQFSLARSRAGRRVSLHEASGWRFPVRVPDVSAALRRTLMPSPAASPCWLSTVNA